MALAALLPLSTPPSMLLTWSWGWPGMRTGVEQVSKRCSLARLKVLGSGHPFRLIRPDPFCGENPLMLRPRLHHRKTLQHFSLILLAYHSIKRAAVQYLGLDFLPEFLFPILTDGLTIDPAGTLLIQEVSIQHDFTLLPRSTFFTNTCFSANRIRLDSENTQNIVLLGRRYPERYLDVRSILDKGLQRKRLML